MPIQKNAWIRHRALDTCLSDKIKQYTIEDLVDACNKALELHDSNTNGVSKRTVYGDLNFLASDAGYEAEINKTKDGKWVYYSYCDPHFSLVKAPLKKHELEQLHNALILFQRISGLPQFEGLEELNMKLESGLQLPKDQSRIISFEQNPYLKGLDHLQALWDAIRNQTKLKLVYQGFKQTEARESIVYPYYLKQYNSRWFLFAWNDSAQMISNFALDRIKSFEHQGGTWRKADFDIEEWLEDAVGVSIPVNGQPENVVIEVDDDLLPYFETKPIHGSQRIQKDAQKPSILKLKVFVNFELKRLLLSFGAQIKVTEPLTLQDELKEMAEALYKRYH